MIAEAQRRAGAGARGAGMMAISKEQRRVLALVADGADVWGYVEAGVCRELERMTPPLVRIMQPRMAPKNGARAQPYFGARATAAGLKELH